MRPQPPQQPNSHMPALWLCALLLLASTIGTVEGQSTTITSVSPKTGSINGGSTLTILGTYFDITANNNVIYIGTVGVCTVIPLRSSTTHLECTTPDGPAGKYDLTIVSSGFAAKCLASSGCYFAYTLAATPVVNSVLPQFLQAPAAITFSGNGFSIVDTSVMHFDFNVKADNSVCDIGDNTLTTTSFACNLSSIRAGVRDITVTLANGQATSPTIQVTIVPTISSYTPLSGSVAGGQTVTIYGFGFSEDLVENKIHIDGAPCIASGYTSRYITCVTTAHSDTASTPAPSQLAGAIPGVLVESWVALASGDVTQLTQVEWFLQPPFAQVTSTIGNTIINNELNYIASRYTGYFTAPIAGNYTFYYSADDFGEVWMSPGAYPYSYTINIDSGRIIGPTIYGTTYASAPIWLASGEVRWIAAYLKNNQGATGATAQVLYPNASTPVTLGSNNMVYAPPLKSTVSVHVNSIPSRCEQACISSRYVYDANLAAVVTAVSPSVAAPGARITITGSGFSTVGTSVSVGATVCIVQSVTPTTVLCVLDGSVFGSQKVTVRTAGNGNALCPFSISGTASITSISPTQGSGYGGVLLTIYGSGFGDDASLVNVYTGGVLCPIETISSTVIFCTTAPHAFGNANVTITIYDVVAAVLPGGYAFTQLHIIPGTTNETSNDPTFLPISGSVLGGTVLSIVVPTLGASSAKDITVYFVGDIATTPCVVLYAFRSRVTCRTTAHPAEITSLIVSNATNVTNLGDYLFEEYITSISANAIGPSAQSGAYIVAYFQLSSPQLDQITMSVNGVPCTSVRPTRTYAACYFPGADLLIASSVTLPQIALYDFTELTSTQLATQFLSSSATLISGLGLYVAAGGYAYTKVQFNRNIVIRATVQATTSFNTLSTGSSCIYFKAFFPDLVTASTGYQFFLGRSDKGMGLRIDSWDASVNTQFLANSRLNATGLTVLPTEWRIELRADTILFYINNVLIASYQNSAYTSGSIGFGSSCQDIIVSKIVVEDQTPISVLVSHKGVPLRNPFDIVPSSFSTVVSGMPTVVVPGTYYSINQTTNGGYNPYALPVGAAWTEEIASLCNDFGRSATNIFYCRIAGIPAGRYIPTLRSTAGFSINSSNTAPIVVMPIITGYSTAPRPHNDTGALLVLTGSSFPVTAELFSITVYGSPCQVVGLSNSDTLWCYAAGPFTGPNTTVVRFADNLVPCTGCAQIQLATAPPVITNVTSSVSSFTRITITGTNFLSTSVVVAGQQCQPVSSSSTSIVCTLGELPTAGPVSVLVEGSNGRVYTTTQVAIAMYLNPATGYLNGGNSITVLGLPFTVANKAISILSYTYNTRVPAGSAALAWGVNPTYVTYSDPVFNRVLGPFSTVTTLSRVVSNIRTHQAIGIKLTAVLIDVSTSNRFVVTVDGNDNIFTWESFKCSPYSFGGSSSVRDCSIFVDLTILHTNPTATIALSSTSQWGLYSFEMTFVKSVNDNGSIDAAFAGSSLALNISGATGPLTYTVRRESIVITAPVSTNARTATVSLAGYSASYIYTAPAASASVDVFSIAAAESSFIPRGVIAHTPEGRISRLDSSSGWNSGVVSFRSYTNTEFKSVTFRIPSPTATGVSMYFMVGLISNDADTSSTYSDMDFAFYHNGGNDVVVYEKSTYKVDLGNYYSGADFTLACADDQCSGLMYIIDSKVVYVSDRRPGANFRVKVSVNYPGLATEAITVVTRTSTPALRTVAVTGSGLTSATQYTPYINGAPCALTYYQTRLLVCAVPAEAVNETGLNTVQIYDNVRGFGVVQTLASAPLIITSLYASGSISGGQRQQITGVQLQGAAPIVIPGCDVIVRNAFNLIECTTKASTGTINLLSSLDGQEVSTITGRTLQYTYTTTPTINSASTGVISGSSSLTLFGNNFVNGNTIRVDISGATCPVTSVTGSIVVCSVPNTVPAGQWNATIVTDEYGRSTAYPVTILPFINTNTSNFAIGTLGAARVVVAGSGFGGSNTASILDSTNAPICTSISRSATALVCEISAAVTASSFTGPFTLYIGATYSQVLPITIAASNNAVITSVSPSTAAGGEILRVYGSNLDGASVTIGSVECSNLVLAAASNFYTCRISAPLHGGSHAVSVRSAAGLGQSTATIVPRLAIFDVKNVGNNSIQIQASGLPQAASLRVLVNGVASPIYALTATSLLCTVAVPTNYIGKFVDVVLQTTPTNIAHSSTWFSTASTSAPAPTVLVASSPFLFVNFSYFGVDSIFPTAGTAAGGVVVTITGRNFDINPQNTIITIGGARCMTQSVSVDQSSVTCVTAPTTANATSAVIVSAVGYGWAAQTFAFDSYLSVDSIAQPSLSTEGGLPVVLTGTGFVPTGLYSVAFDGIVCPVTSVTTTTITCSAPPSPRPLAPPRRTQVSGTVEPALVNSYPRHPDGTFGIQVTFNGISALVKSHVRVDYSEEATPEITAVTLTDQFGNSTEQVLTNTEVIFIHGTGFAHSGNSVRIVSRITGATGNCSILSESSTLITCALSVSVFGEAYVRVFVPGKGLSYSKRTCPEGSFLMCDGSCLTDLDCSASNWGRYGCASVQQLISGDTYCDSNGGTDLVNTRLKMDNGDIYNLNCPMYSCEGNDCNTTVSIAGRSARISTCGKDPNGFVIGIAPVILELGADYSSSVNGGLRVSLSGRGLLMSAYVFIGETPCTVITANGTSLECETQAASPSYNLTLTLYSAEGIEAICANCTGFSYSLFDTPLVESTAFSYLNGQSLITVNGYDFAPFVDSNVVAVGGVICPVVNASRNTIICQAPNLPFRRVGYTITVRVLNIGLASFNSTAASTIAYMAQIIAISSAAGSRSGGHVITISGFGFAPSATRVFANCELTVLSSTATTVVARTASCTAGVNSVRVYIDITSSYACNPVNASLSTTACQYNYATASTPSVSSFTATTTQLTIKGSFLSGALTPVVTIGTSWLCAAVSSNTTTIVCNAPLSAATGGAYPFTLAFTEVGLASGLTTSSTFTFPLTVSSITPTLGSINGGQLVTISGTGFGSVRSVLVVRVGSAVCTVQSTSFTTLVCRTSAASTAGLLSVTVIAYRDATLATVAGSASTSSAIYQYSSDVAAVVSSVTPYRGSTAGGTMLTIVGTNLIGTTNVTIDGVACPQTAIDVQLTALSNGTEYHCTTKAHPTMMDGVLIIVESAFGYAVNVNTTYTYIDLWSRQTTWGNTPPPIAQDSVVISEGQTVMLDISPPQLYLVIVMSGVFIFDPTQDLTLEATYIVVNYGRLIIGESMDQPYTKKALIRLWGDRLTPEIPSSGSKVIFMRNGRIDIHGIPRNPTWTRLNATAPAGTATLTVQGPVDWQPGETIVVSSTDFEPMHYERFNIMSVTQGDGLSVILGLDAPIQWEKFGERQCFDNGDGRGPVCVDEMAEVILLTRNIEIVGDPLTEANHFGAQVFVMPLGANESKYCRITHVEVHQSGQRYLLGRYSVHFHVTGAVSSSYIIGNSVYDTYNRAFTIHGTNNNTYIRNVVCNTEGHSFFFEDGSEHYNYLRENVVMGTKVSTSNLNSDLSPANFWITNALNYFYGNVAAGSDFYGFWFSPFDPHSTGPTASVNICPPYEQNLAFVGQVSHSHGNYGINVKPEWYPKTINCNAASADKPTVLWNTTIWKTQKHGINYASGFGSIELRGFTFADIGKDEVESSHVWTETRDGSMLNMTQGVSNTNFIAFTGNQPYHRGEIRRGINMPLHDNWFMRNLTFVNFINENWATQPFRRQQRMKLNYPWGWMYYYDGMRWINSPQRALLRFQHNAILFDKDGTLTDSTPGSFMVPWTPIFDPTLCVSRPDLRSWWPILVCQPSYPIRRLGIGNTVDLAFDQLFTIENRTERVYKLDQGYAVTVPINRNLRIVFDSYSAPTNFWWQFNPRYFSSTERILYEIWHPEERLKCYATFDGAVGPTVNNTPMLNWTTSTSFWNSTTWIHYALAKRPTTQTNFICQNCPSYGCPSSAAPALTNKDCSSFNKASSWASNSTPGVGADVNVTSADSICLDNSTPTWPNYNIGRLTVSGKLVFQDYMCPADGSTVRIYIGKLVHILGGAFMIGNSTNPIVSCRVEIIMPDMDYFNNTDTSLKTLQPFGSRIFAVQYGRVQFFGKNLINKVNLAKSSASGSNTLVVDVPVNWAVGDKIGLAQSSRPKMFPGLTELVDESEILTIASLSTDKKTIGVVERLRYAHYGTVPQTINGTVFAAGAEVVILSKYITIRGKSDPSITPTYTQGWQLTMGCSSAIYQGCIGVNYMSPNKPGTLQLSGVALYNAGQAGSLHGAVEIDGLVQYDGENTFLRNVSLWSPLSTGIFLRDTSQAIELTDNVVFNATGGDGIRAISTGNVLTRNIVLSQGPSLPFCKGTYDLNDECKPAGFRITAGNAVIGNIAGSSVGAGFVTDGSYCDGTFNWTNNFAHSARDGLLIYESPAPSYVRWPAWNSASLCRVLGGVTTYNNGDTGMTLWYVNGNVRVTNYGSVGNMFGLVALLYDPRTDTGDNELTMNVSNSFFAGRWTNDSCIAESYVCRMTEFDDNPWCMNFQDNGVKIGNAGLIETVFLSSSYTGRTLGEHKYFFHEPDSYHAVRGKAYITNVHFDNFDGDTACGHKSVAFYQHPFSNDTFHQHLFNKVTWGSGMNMTTGQMWAKTTYGPVPNLFTHSVPEDIQTMFMNFDDRNFGGYWPDSHNHIWMIDTDGSFTQTGKVTNLLSSQSITRNSTFNAMGWTGVMDVNTIGPIRPGCTFKSGWNMFTCNKSFNFLRLALESTADDALTRRVAPVVLCKGDGMFLANGDPICQGGIVDFASGPVPKGKGHQQILSRMARWWFVAENLGNYTLYFRGSPPTNFRIRVLDYEYLEIDPSKVGLVLNVKIYGNNAQMRQGVWVDGVKQFAVFGFDYPYVYGQTWPAPLDPPGTHYMDKYVVQNYQRNVLSLTVRPNHVLEVRAEMIVAISMTVSMPASQFFNQKNSFAIALALVLGVDPSRLKFVTIVAGTTRRRRLDSDDTSTQLSIEIDGGNETMNTSTTEQLLTTVQSTTPSDIDKSMSENGVNVTTIITATAAIVYVQTRPNVTVSISYLFLNVSTPSAGFNGDLVAQTVASAFRGTQTSLPFNETDASQVIVGTNFTDLRYPGTTSFVLAFTYSGQSDNALATTNCLAFMAASLFADTFSDNMTRALPEGYSIVSSVFNANGGTICLTPAPPTTATTKAPTTTTTTTTTTAAPTTTTTTAAPVIVIEDPTTTTTTTSAPTTTTSTTTTTAAPPATDPATSAPTSDSSSEDESTTAAPTTVVTPSPTVAPATDSSSSDADTSTAAPAAPTTSAPETSSVTPAPAGSSSSGEDAETSTTAASPADSSSSTGGTTTTAAPGSSSSSGAETETPSTESSTAASTTTTAAPAIVTTTTTTTAPGAVVTPEPPTTTAAVVNTTAAPVVVVTPNPTVAPTAAPTAAVNTTAAPLVVVTPNPTTAPTTSTPPVAAPTTSTTTTTTTAAPVIVGTSSPTTSSTAAPPVVTPTTSATTTTSVPGSPATRKAATSAEPATTTTTTTTTASPSAPATANPTPAPTDAETTTTTTTTTTAAPPTTAVPQAMMVRFSGTKWGSVLSTNLTTLKQTVLGSLAAALGVTAAEISITNMYEGSLVVEFTVVTSKSTADIKTDLQNSPTTLTAPIASFYVDNGGNRNENIGVTNADTQAAAASDDKFGGAGANGNSGETTGLAIGLGVGAVIVIAAVVGIVIVVRKRRIHPASGETDSSTNSSSDNASVDSGTYLKGGYGIGHKA